MPGTSADGTPAAESGSGVAQGVPTVAVVTASQLASMLQARERGEAQFELVDVREPGERDVVSIPGARAIHLDEFRTGAAARQLPDGIPVVVHCKSGARSAEAAALLVASGRPDVSNLAGGVLAWVRDVDPSLPTY
jgi:sulfur-carrier protein adenylyltransferase/sulfurtransferase